MYFVGILNHKYGISLLLWQTMLAITKKSKISLLCFSIMVLVMNIIIASTEQIKPTSIISSSDISELCESPGPWLMHFCNRKKWPFKY